MTRKEAISFAISTRKPIRHSTFGKNEYVKFYTGTFGNETWMIDEEGTFLPYDEFWAIRSGDFWEDGWNEFVFDVSFQEL